MSNDIGTVLILVLAIWLVLGLLLGSIWLASGQRPSFMGKGKQADAAEANPLDRQIRGFALRQWRQFGFVLVLGISGLFVHFLMGYDMELFDTAALYIGFPFILALGMCFIPKAKSRVTATLKGLTIALLLSFPLFNEGVICVLMASPIFYGVGVLSAWSMDKHEKEEKGSKLQLAIVASVLAIASLEGVTELTTFPRNNVAEYSRVINAPIEDVRAHIANTPEINESRPFYMRLFPLPVSASGSGLEIGDERKLDYVYKKWIWTNEKSGSTTFRVAENQEDYIRFDIAHDDSYLATYLTWQSSEVLLEPINANNTKVTWRLSYERKLDPIWYFGPMQKHYVMQTAKTLIDNVADPAL